MFLFLELAEGVACFLRLQAKDQRNGAAPVCSRSPQVGRETPANAFGSKYLEFLMKSGRGARRQPNVTPRMTLAYRIEIPGSAKIPKWECSLRLY
jgi:hypothetical protein